MIRTRSIKTARAFARERGACYGLSALDGWYYVGLPLGLESVGVVTVRTPSESTETMRDPGEDAADRWNEGQR